MRVSVDVATRTVRVEGDLDLASAAEFARAVDGLVAEPGDIAVELDGVDFLDSSGLRAIFDLVRALGARGRVVLCRPAPQARRVLQLVRAETIVEIRD